MHADSHRLEYTSLSCYFRCSNVKSYTIISGSISVSQSGGVYTFSTSASANDWRDGGAWIYASNSGVVDITFNQ